MALVLIVLFPFCFFMVQDSVADARWTGFMIGQKNNRTKKDNNGLA